MVYASYGTYVEVVCCPLSCKYPFLLKPWPNVAKPRLGAWGDDKHPPTSWIAYLLHQV